MSNPFSSFGAVVFGERFAGRQREMRSLRERLAGGDPASISIVGLPRIGKTSLAYHALRENAIGLDDNVLVLWLNVRACATDFGGLINSVAKHLTECLDDRGLLDVPLRDAGAAVGLAPSDPERLHALQVMLRRVRRRDLAVIVALDEFDGVRSLFDYPAYGFAALRELAHEPDSRLAWVTISRRPLVAIATRATMDESTFPNIFSEIRLRPFGVDEFEELVAMAGRAGYVLSPEMVERIEVDSGRHPYLASHMLDEACSNPGATPGAVVEHCSGLQLDYIKDLMERFEKDAQSRFIYEILVGPAETATAYDVAELERYGIVRTNDSGNLEAFLPLLERYLEVTVRGVDYWPLWCETERTLRVVIIEALQRHYGAPLDWSSVARSNSKLAPLIESLELKRDKEIKTFGPSASPELLDFTYPMDLFSIISTHWNSVFKTLFGKDLSYWSQRFSVLAKVRTPIAHTRERVLSAQDRDEARGACRGILAAVAKDESWGSASGRAPAA